jgi:hypothetical protein
VVLEDALYAPLFLEPEADVADALQLFRRQRKLMAVVREEGRVLGLITMEDILEEIVGDIEDEHDGPTPTLRLKRQPLVAGPQMAVGSPAGLDEAGRSPQPDHPPRRRPASAPRGSPPGC